MTSQPTQPAPFGPDAVPDERTPRRVKTVAVVLAGGVGVRMGLDLPKQFVPIAGRTSLEHAVRVFDECEEIDEIIVMMDPPSLDRARAVLTAAAHPKLTAILAGGSTRNETSYLALQQIAEPDTKVLFHDAVRPLLDASVVRACLDALDRYDAVDTAIPSADTIIEVDGDDVIRAIPERGGLRRGQTPQGFRHGTILSAYEKAHLDPDFRATDDCSVVLKYRPDVPIIVVPGHEANIKITHPIDIHLADKLFQLKHDVVDHASTMPGAFRGSVVVVFGGSSGIGEAVAAQLTEGGASVVSHSRSTTGVFVEDRESVATALDEARDRYGRIDHIILTAGVLTVGNLADLTDEQVRHDLAVNLLGPLNVAQQGVRHLAESRGSLLFYSSSSSTRGRAGYTVYSSTKAAVVNLTQALADEWQALGVRVNCISPSRTATPMRKLAFGDEDESSLVDPAEVARVSLSVLASGATGQVYDVRVPTAPASSVPQTAAHP